MWRLLKLLFFLAVIGFLGVVGYALVGDMSPPSGETTHKVTIEVD